MTAAFAPKIDMQHKLFAELSTMFAQEVPMYDRSLLVNTICNRAVCDLLGMMHGGFVMTDQQLARTSGERHGAIRIGRPDEYRWIARFFAQFGMQPHNYYDMSSIGEKSQPIVATAFRSVLQPEHRVFTSLLQTDYFDMATQARIERVLAQRQVFSDSAKSLIEKAETEGGLSWPDADRLVREGTTRIFKWTGTARDYPLYKELCDTGFKIAADIACFDRHHLNHLTPNTFCMDLYTSAMKMCMGKADESDFRSHAVRALTRMLTRGDGDFLRLTFRHLTPEVISSFKRARPGAAEIDRLVDALTARLNQPDADMRALPHSGFKDITEGPSEDTPVFLRQDAYRALSEQVIFTNLDGSTVQATHTARFGEIEQRFYACTPEGRALYDRCLAAAEADPTLDSDLPTRDPVAYEAAYARHFAPFPKTLRELLASGLVFGLYSAVERGAGGRTAHGSIDTVDLEQLLDRGFIKVEGLRYEDFLPVSAAGIFASNLNQYGTVSTAMARPKYTREKLEEVIGGPIVDVDALYRGQEAASILNTYAQLGILDRVDAKTRERLNAAIESMPMEARGEIESELEHAAPARG